MKMAALKQGRWKKRILGGALALSVAACVLGDSASLTTKADAPYKSYTVDGYGSVTETQTAYLPYKTLTKVGDEALLSPTDFCLLKDGSMYILDSGNARVVVSDLEGNLISTFGEGTLVTPRGIFVTEDHITYVADRDAKSIFVFDAQGNLTQTYGRPDVPMYGETQDFLPLKIVVNSSGTMYIVCESNTNGIVEISPVDGGTFLGGGIGFDQGPVAFLPQDMDRLAGAGDDADVVFTLFIRLRQDTDLFPLLSLNDGDGLGQDFPDGRLIHAAHLQVPEADVVIALNGAVLVGRMIKDVGGEQRVRGGEVFVLPLEDIEVFFRQTGYRKKNEYQ